MDRRPEKNERTALEKSTAGPRRLKNAGGGLSLKLDKLKDNIIHGINQPDSNGVSLTITLN